jgi:hypothetical protein
MSRIKLLPVFFGVLLVLAAAAIPAAQEASQKEEFRAFVARGDIDTLRTVSSVATIVIDRWTTPAELSELVQAYNDLGEKGFLEILRKLPKVGYFRMPDTIGYDLQCALQEPLPEGGRRIFLATDRPILFSEQYNQSRSTQYPFTVIQLSLGKNNRGDGMVSEAARIVISTDGKYFDVENFGPFPLLLKSVKKIK